MKGCQVLRKPARGIVATDMELAYLAGFFDGEGSISFHEKRPSIIRVTLSISNTASEPIEMIVRVFGGDYHVGYYGAFNRNRIHYRWQCASINQTRLILQSLLPYLVVKKAKAIEALEVLGED